MNDPAACLTRLDHWILSMLLTLAPKGSGFLVELFNDGREACSFYPGRRRSKIGGISPGARVAQSALGAPVIVAGSRQSIAGSPPAGRQNDADALLLGGIVDGVTCGRQVRKTKERLEPSDAADRRIRFDPRNPRPVEPVIITNRTLKSARNMTDRKPADDNRAEPQIVISVIIATYNACELLANCLSSIEQNRPNESYEIIVVDDASADGTSEMVRSRFPEARLLRNEVNRHYAFSNNRAFECARGEYLFLLNNDTIVLPDALDRMVAFLREHPEAGAVGCKLLNEDGSIQWSVKSLPNPGSALFGARSIITGLFPNNPFSRHHLLHLDRDMTTAVAAGYVSSAAIMIPRHVIDKVGGLDRRLSYHVDADYCKRIANLGYKSYYLPTATMIHLNHKGGTMVSLRRRFRSLVEFHVGSYIYYRKHVQSSVWPPMHIIVVLGLFARFLVSVLVRIGTELVSIARRPAGCRLRRTAHRPPFSTRSGAEPAATSHQGSDAAM